MRFEKIEEEQNVEEGLVKVIERDMSLRNNDETQDKMMLVEGRGECLCLVYVRVKMILIIFSLRCRLNVAAPNVAYEYSRLQKSY